MNETTAVIMDETGLEMLVPWSSKDPQAILKDPEATKSLILAVEAVVAEPPTATRTATERKAIASLAYKVARTKTYLDGIGKDLVAELKDLPKRIDANRKLWRDSLDAIAERVRKPLTEWEQAEEARKARILARIHEIKTAVIPVGGYSSKKLAAVIEQIQAIQPTPDEFEEYADEAKAAKEKTLETLAILRDQKVVEEAQAEELKRLREERAAAEAKEREDRIRREAEDKARAEMEAKAKAEQEASTRREMEARIATEQAERRAQEAEARAAKAKEDAEAEALIRQLEAEQKAAEEQARREADLNHRRNINREALADMKTAINSAVTGLGEDSAQAIAISIVRAVATGQVRHMTMSY